MFFMTARIGIGRRSKTGINGTMSEKIGFNGEFIPNAKWYALNGRDSNTAVPDVPGRATCLYFGATHLLDEVAKASGVTDDLQLCFPDAYKQIFSLAYYLVLEGGISISRFSGWAHDHSHSQRHELSSQLISDIVLQIPEHAKLDFFRQRSSRIVNGEYLVYDTTSVSSYSEAIRAARYGKNKDDDSLPQVNIALLVWKQSALPVYYGILPGNIADVSTINRLVSDVAFINIQKLCIVMDSGFFSTSNTDALFATSQAFVVGAKASTKSIERYIDMARTVGKRFRNFADKHGVYSFTYTAEWPVEGGKYCESARNTKRLYVHVYFDGTRAEDEKIEFMRSVERTTATICAGERLSSRQDMIRRKFIVSGSRIEFNEKAIHDHMDRIGYFALICNGMDSAPEALEAYRWKDVVEKAFDNCHDAVESRRSGVHSDAALGGTVFVQFVALILISYIQKRMRNSGLFKNYTMQSLFDTLDVIERCEYNGQSNYSEITNKQRELYASLGLSAPDTL